MQHAQQLTDAFSSAVPFALAEMAGVESVLLDSKASVGAVDAGDVSVVLQLIGASPGMLRLSMPGATATALAGRILADTVPNPDRAMIHDCIGEVANIIAGQAKTLLYGTPLHFSFSPPVQGDFDSLPQAEALQLKYGSDVGELTLTVHPPTES